MATIVSATNSVGKLLAASGVAKNTYVIASGVTDIVGSAANDIFRSNGAGSTMHGGLGDDTYIVYTAKDIVQEGVNAGIDTVVSTISYKLGANLENLELTSDRTYALGNSLDNLLKGGAGSQTLDGAGGDDVLTGGDGADTFVAHKGGGRDTITDFVSGTDRVRLQGLDYTDFGQVQSAMTQKGADVLLTFNGADSLLFKNHKISDFHASDFMLNLDTSHLKLTFDDEFSNGLSLWNGKNGTWRTVLGYGGPAAESNRHLNDEAEVYTDAAWKGTDGKMTPIDPFSVTNGILNITASKLTAAQSAENWGLQFSSGVLTTRFSYAQEYGYFEVKAKLPAGQGAWPAFWLLPVNGDWPPELDVFEELGKDPNTLYTTAHTAETGRHTAVQSAVLVDDVTQAFHTYGVLWDKDKIVWYVDGTEVSRTATPDDMHSPMYLLLNLGIGGQWGGGLDSTTPNSSVLQVDYVHAYALPDSLIAEPGDLAASAQVAATAAAVAQASAAGGHAITHDSAITAAGAALPTVNSDAAAASWTGGSGGQPSTAATTPTTPTTAATTTGAVASPAVTPQAATDTTPTTSAGATAPAGYANPAASLGAADVFKGTAITDQWTIKYAQLSASSTAIQKAITGFANGGTWTATNNDWLSLTGFSKGSTMSWDHDVGADGHTGVYRIHDAATNHDFFIQIESLNGKHVALGDYNFF